MTEEEKNQKMIRDYQLSAKGLKRDIMRLKLELAKTTRPDDRYQLARRIEALECCYYDVVWGLRAMGGEEV